MNIVKLKPYCKSAIWGGDKLRLYYGKEASFNVAESWELSGYPGKESEVCGGAYDGQKITEIIEKQGQKILGTKASGYKGLPLLIKLIDSATPLSVQVHPDDETAKRLNADGGKTEMWIICESEKDSYIYFGVREKISSELFGKAIKDGTITEYLNKIPVKPGDTFFIKAGTVHAIGAGITLCEIQQTSDTTYRLFDYNRIDSDGKPRELHIEKGTKAADLNPPDRFYESGIQLGNEIQLVSCEYFTVSRIEVKEKTYTEVDNESFASFTVINGEGRVVCNDESFNVKKGDTFMAFAGSGEIEFSGIFSVIKATL